MFMEQEIAYKKAVGWIEGFKPVVFEGELAIVDLRVVKETEKAVQVQPRMQGGVEWLQPVWCPKSISTVKDGRLKSIAKWFYMKNYHNFAGGY